MAKVAVSSLPDFGSPPIFTTGAYARPANAKQQHSKTDTSG